DGLKRCAEAALPLIYFLQVKARPAEHVVFAPVYVIGWDDERRRFLVDLSEQRPDEFVTPVPSIKQLHLPQIRTPESPSEIGERTIGDGERAMLLAYDGKKLSLPSDQRLWPALP